MEDRIRQARISFRFFNHFSFRREPVMQAPGKFHLGIREVNGMIKRGNNKSGEAIGKKGFGVADMSSLNEVEK